MSSKRPQSNPRGSGPARGQGPGRGQGPTITTISRTPGSATVSGRTTKPPKKHSASGHDTRSSRLASTHNAMQPHVTSNVQVEQLNTDHEVESQTLKLDTLMVPDSGDNDDSSEASSLTPDDKDSSLTEDDSIAVDCHINPSEVIVKGKNVKQIRVKFPPHPPNSEEPRTKSGRRRLHRGTTTPSQHPNLVDTLNRQEDKLPYSQEETSLPAIAETPSELTGVTLPAIGRQDSTISLHSNDLPFNQYYANTNRSLTSANMSVDWDVKYKQDILGGLDYFERKAFDVKDLNNRITQELDILKKKNRELEQLVNRLQKERFHLLSDMEEIKIKLDETGKESSILQDQATDQWRACKELEEMYVELQTDSNKQISSLKEALAHTESNREIATLKAALTEKDKELQRVLKHKDIPLNNDTKPPAKELVSRGLSDDSLELLHKVSCLQEEIKKITREKDITTDSNTRLKQDVENVKAELKNKNHELESQYKRFLSLKKSFNDLDEEHENLKAQLRGRSNNHHGQREHVSNNLANSTWPAANTTTGQAKSETVSYIDLPKDNRAPGTSTNGTTTFKSLPLGGVQARPRRGSISKGVHVTHKRNKSEVTSLTDNLPPVPNPTR